MSEFPEPWHRIDPAHWPAVGRRVSSLIRAAEDSSLELPTATVARLRRVLPPPVPAPKLTPSVSPYGHAPRRRLSNR